MIICITEWFDKLDRYGYKTGEKEFLVSHGINSETMENVVLPCDHPLEIGQHLVKNLKNTYWNSLA